MLRFACPKKERDAFCSFSLFFNSLSLFPLMLPAASSRCCLSVRQGATRAIRFCLSNRNQQHKAPILKARAMATSSHPLPFGDVFFLDSFALRQWSETASGTRFDPKEVSLQSVVDTVHAAQAAGSAMVDG